MAIVPVVKEFEPDINNLSAPKTRSLINNNQNGIDNRRPVETKGQVWMDWIKWYKIQEQEGLQTKSLKEYDDRLEQQIL